MAFEQSILKSTKKLLNVGVDDDSFDQDIITHINSAFTHLLQLGIGPVEGFFIEDDTVVWEDFILAPDPMLHMVKTNIQTRVRLAFDPPQMPHLLKALQDQLLESDVRLNIMREEVEWAIPEPEPNVIDGGDAEGD